MLRKLKSRTWQPRFNTEKNQKVGYVPEGKIVGLGKEAALYSMLETCNHLKEDKVEVRTLLEPHLIKT